MTERNVFKEVKEGFDALEAKRKLQEEAKDAFEKFCLKMLHDPEPDRSTWTYPDVDAETAYRAFIAGAEWGAVKAVEAFRGKP